MDIKGKSKETERMSDFDAELWNLNPTITYRHLLSNVPDPQNPLRVVALCDMNAFYAACERVRLGLGEDVALAVQQWNALIAITYPAREYGIKRMDKVKDAVSKCPHLIVVHTATYCEGETEPVYRPNPDLKRHKVSLDYYRGESIKIANMLKDTVTLGEVEKASIDECFIDFTPYVKDEILKMFPELSQPPKDSPLGLDTPLPPPPSLPLTEGVTAVIPVDYIPEKPPEVKSPEPENRTDKDSDTGDDQVEDMEEEFLLDEDEDMMEELHLSAQAIESHEARQLEEHLKVAASSDRVMESLPPEEDDFTTKTWHDVALYISSKLMQRCRDRVKHELGYPNTAGMARNKFLAKLAANFKKRDSQIILRNSAIPNYLRATPFQKIRNFGGKLGKALALQYDVATVGDLLTVSLDELRKRFGDGSLWIYGILRGVDLSEVKEKGHVKSMGSSKNLPKPIEKYTDGHHWLLMMSSELSHRLINARAESPGLWPKTISLFLSKGWKQVKRKQGPFPFSRDISPAYVCSIADKLWRELLGDRRSVKEPLGFTHVGLSFHGIEIVAAGQQHINGFLKPGSPSAALKRKRSVSRSPAPRRTKSPSVASAPEEIIDMTSLTGDEAETSEESGSSGTGNNWKCPKCRKKITVESIGDYDDANAELARLQLIHEDGHFAESLSASLNNTAKVPSSSSPTIRSPLGSVGKSQKHKTGSKKKKQEGLLNFFQRK